MGLKLLAEGSTSSHLMSSLQSKDAELDCERDLFSSGDAHDRMPAGGDPLKGIKKTMLYHEHIFQCQVAELHRLYWMQKNLMNSLYCNEFGNKSAAWSRSLVPVPENASSLKYSSGISKQFKGFSSALCQDQQRSFNLQLPADEYINNAGDRYRHANGSIRNNILVNPEALGLTLGIRENVNTNKGKRSIGRTLDDKEDFLYSHEVIDLEDSMESEENEEGTIVSSFDLKTPVLHNDVRYNSKLPRLFDMNSSGIAKKDLGFTNSVDPAYTGQSEVSSIKSGNLFNSKLPCSPPRQALFDLNTVQAEEPSSWSAGPSAYPCGLTGEFHASVSNGADSEDRETDLLFNGYEVSHTRSRSDFDQSSKAVSSSWNCVGDDGTVVFMKSDFKDVLELNRLPTGHFSDGFVEGTEQSSNGSSPLPPSNMYNLSYNYKDANLPLVHPFSNGRNASFIIDIKGSNCLPSLESTNLPCTLARDVEVKQAEGERSEEDTVSSSMNGNQQVQADIPGFNVEQPVQRDKNLVRDKSKNDNLNNLCRVGCQDLHDINEDNQITGLDSQVAGTCSTPIIKFSGSAINPEERLCGHKELQSHDQTVLNEKLAADMDPMVLMAAEYLVLLSSENLAVSPFGCTEVLPEMDLETQTRNEHELPQYSSDSLEHLVLAMPECREEDECSMPAKPEEAVVAKGMFRFNSRRGRQLRDFQKDILPGLVSLSRHEICEDMHAFTEIARLDELWKKGTTSNSSRGNRNITVRSRRPRRR